MNPLWPAIAVAAGAGWTSMRQLMSDKSVPCNFPRSQEEIKKRKRADKARKAAKKARRRNRR